MIGKCIDGRQFSQFSNLSPLFENQKSAPMENILHQTRLEGICYFFQKKYSQLARSEPLVYTKFRTASSKLTFWCNFNFV